MQRAESRASVKGATGMTQACCCRIRLQKRRLARGSGAELLGTSGKSGIQREYRVSPP
jgi:hypothetical protein